jgi:DNA-binding response OmpR family regulator
MRDTELGLIRVGKGLALRMRMNGVARLRKSPDLVSRGDLVALPAPTTLPARRRLLLADDDERTTRKLGSMLQEEGYDVEVFLDGRAAMDRLQRDPPPDAIITDLIMPGASGIAVLGEASRRASRIPVIFVTGHPELLAGTAIPFDSSPTVLTKPISYPDLVARLSALLGA